MQFLSKKNPGLQKGGATKEQMEQLEKAFNNPNLINDCIEDLYATFPGGFKIKNGKKVSHKGKKFNPNKRY